MGRILAMFSLVTLVGLGLIALGVHFVHQAYRSLDWAPVHARVVQDKCHTSDGALYRDLVYDYFVIDSTYTSTQVAIGGKSGSQTCTAQYHPGDVIVAYYDPKDPSEAVIERGGMLGASVWLFGGLFFVFMPWYMIWLGKKGREQREADEQDNEGPGRRRRVRTPR